MKPLRVDHIGIMVSDVQQASEQYAGRIGLATDAFLYSEKFGCTIALVRCGDVKLELMQPAPTGAGRDWLNAHGEGLHHICYVVEDLRNAYAEAVALGADRSDGLLIGAEGKEAFFMVPESLNGVITEFIEEDR